MRYVEWRVRSSITVKNVEQNSVQNVVKPNICFVTIALDGPMKNSKREMNLKRSLTKFEYEVVYITSVRVHRNVSEKSNIHIR